MNTSELIILQHLARKTIIYIRQSILHQTITNQENLKLQYALKQCAFELGWQEDNTETIDAELGLIGAEARHHERFKSLLMQITLSKISVILSFDVTRLSHNCSDLDPLKAVDHTLPQFDRFFHILKWSNSPGNKEFVYVEYQHLTRLYIPIEATNIAFVPRIPTTKLTYDGILALTNLGMEIISLCLNHQNKSGSDYQKNNKMKP